MTSKRNRIKENSEYLSEDSWCDIMDDSAMKFVACRPAMRRTGTACEAGVVTDEAPSLRSSRRHSRRGDRSDVTHGVVLYGRKDKEKMVFVARRQSDFQYSGRQRQEEAQESLPRFLLFITVFLAGAWFIPQIATLYDALEGLTLGTVTAQEVLNILAVPVAVALTLFATLLPLERSVKLVLLAVFSITVIALPLLLGKQVLPIEGPVMLAACLLASFLAIVAFSVLNDHIIGYVTLLVLPLALFGTLLVCVFNGEYPAGFVAPFKELFQICAAMALLTMSVVGYRQYR